MFAGDNKNPKLTDKNQYIRTYAALKPIDEGKGLTTKKHRFFVCQPPTGIVNEIVTLIGNAIRKRLQQEPPISEVDIVVKKSAPLVSTFYNKFSFGIYKK